MLVYKRSELGGKIRGNFMNPVKTLAELTYNQNVLSGVGLFAGALDISEAKNYQKPVFVSSVDGVGTKLKIAAWISDFTYCGMDVVNHCLNDVVCLGARPIAFLDYIASEKLEQKPIEQIIHGMSIACCDQGVPLLGGETAEMKGFYNLGDWEVVGFAAGLVEKDKIIIGRDIKPGDVLIGLESSGIHTNGYTLIRKIFFDFDIHGLQKRGIKDFIPGLGNKEFWRLLLEPHRCYAKTVLSLLSVVKINGIAHITGGGIPENLSRILPKSCAARIVKSYWHIPEIFKFIQKEGELSEKTMFNAFNMGIGMILVVPPDFRDAALEFLNNYLKCRAFDIGAIIKSENEAKIIIK